jgi:hypothetical protein
LTTTIKLPHSALIDRTREMPRKFVCSWCSSFFQCGFCPRLGELLALREWAIHCEDADTAALINIELEAWGVLPPANDNEPRS